EINNLRVALRNKNLDKALSIIKSAIADLPTIVKKDMCENYYESVTHLMFRMTGWRVVSELQSVAGRSDVVVATKDSVFIFELKMDRGRTFDEVSDEGLNQIDENGYSERFIVSGKEMKKVCLVFSSEGKGLLGWKVK
ncbi:MAG: PD-(D/E)XK nuclease domain-containing protein, partial [Treponema sp.]|nr:PD-(D/E)XK nuclease domain-containing protein [Treponema sp.]